MNVSGIQNAMIGMAIFDLWDTGMSKTKRMQRAGQDPLIAAADKAFRAYVKGAEIGFAAQIAGVAMYALNPGGQTVSPVTSQELAPFLALNVLA